LSTTTFSAATFAAASEMIFASTAAFSAATFAAASAITFAAASAIALSAAATAAASARAIAAAAASAATQAALQAGSGAGVGAAGGEEVVIDVDAVEATDVAAAFVAVTVNVYAVDAVNPETVIGDELPDTVIPPGDEVTVYVVIALLPLLDGAVKLTVAVVCPVEVAVTDVGAPGAVAAVTEIDAVPEPLGLDAVFTARI
jgi:hypothetical protein